MRDRLSKVVFGKEDAGWKRTESEAVDGMQRMTGGNSGMICRDSKYKSTGQWSNEVAALCPAVASVVMVRYT